MAAEIRAELYLDPHSPLDMWGLADHLGIPVHPLSSLNGDGRVVAALEYLRGLDHSEVSAMTIFPDWPNRRRVVILNDAHSLARQHSDLAHELAHGLLLHEPGYPIVNGCRDYRQSDESEAAWLSGCLLVPRDAALVVARSDTPVSQAAADFAVSVEMMTWRINVTGVRRQVEATAKARRPSVR